MTDQATLPDLSPAEICEIGIKLYGLGDWRGAMADDLDVNFRTVRAWGTGRNKMPIGVRHTLASRLRDLADRIDHLADNLAPEAP